MNQLVTIKYNVKAPAGQCLWFGQEMLGVPHVYLTAHDAYEATILRHFDKNFPVNLAVPVWFEWWGKLDGDIEAHQYDHLAVIVAGGTVYSSPLAGVGRAVFNSVDDLVRAFGGGMRYIGWTEDISGIKVIGGSNMNDEDEISKLWEALNASNQDKDKLWTTLDSTNKNGDILKSAVDDLSKKVGEPVNLDDYSVVLVKKDQKQ